VLVAAAAAAITGAAMGNTGECRLLLLPGTSIFILIVIPHVYIYVTYIYIYIPVCELLVVGTAKCQSNS
jgi:hypothetical protein